MRINLLKKRYDIDDIDDLPSQVFDSTQRFYQLAK